MNVFSLLTIGRRIYLLATVLLLVSLTLATFSISTMVKIGEELDEIANKDFALTEILTKITIHQLEQAITIEKALAHSEEGQVAEISTKFKQLGKKVDEEMVVALEIVGTAIEEAQNEASLKEFQHLETIMLGVAADHKEYEKHGEALLQQLVTAQVADKDLISLVEEEQDHLTLVLEEALFEIERFTSEAVKRTEQNEKTGIQVQVGLSVSGIIIGIFVAMFIARSISRPIVSLTENMDRLAENDTDIAIEGSDQRNEIGSMARALGVFRTNAIEMASLRDQQQHEAEENEKRRQALLIEMAEKIETDIGPLAMQLESSANHLETTALSLGQRSNDGGSKSILVADAAAVASNKVSVLAAASTELSASVDEISTRTELANNSILETVDSAKSASSMLTELVAASSEIGEVVSLIDEIAQQTNLLALNATIEAARAGEAGKGFAVVASEVKNLSSQTSQATEKIANQIVEVQNRTNTTASSIQGIVDKVDNMAVIVDEINHSMEQQTQAIREMAINIDGAAVEATNVSTEIGGVSQSNIMSSSSAIATLWSSEDLKKMERTLASELTALTSALRQQAQD